MINPGSNFGSDVVFGSTGNDRILYYDNGPGGYQYLYYGAMSAGINAVINGGDPSPNGYKTRYARVVRGNWFDHEWSDYDFGVFVLYDNSSSCGLHWHGWRSNSMLSMLGKSIYLYGFPGERRDCAASPASNGWCYGSIYGKGGSVAVATAYRAYYSIDTQPGQSGTGYQCAASLGWGNCNGKVCHYGTHYQNTSSNGSWSANQWNEMHFPSTYSSYASYGNYQSEGTAWCRSCGGGLSPLLNQSSTCCKQSNVNNAKSRWTIWVR